MSDMQQYDVIHSLNSNQRDQLFLLYQNEWWTADRSRDDVDKFLKHSTFYVAFIERTSQKLIGFSRVLTDTIGLAYIYDVIAREDYRNQGLGRKLVEEALSHPLMKDVVMVELVCHKDMCGFYHKFGFSADYQDNRVAMRLYIK